MLPAPPISPSAGSATAADLPLFGPPRSTAARRGLVTWCKGDIGLGRGTLNRRPKIFEARRPGLLLRDAVAAPFQQRQHAVAAQQVERAYDDEGRAPLGHERLDLRHPRPVAPGEQPFAELR